MKIEYDTKDSETVLHLNVEEMGTLVFALDIAEIYTGNPKHKESIKKFRKAIREGM